LTAWNIKAAGALARSALLSWLASSEPDRPYFAFLNYMEAHRPHIPAREYRERFMAPDEVDRSYEVDRSWLPMWEYTFGLRDYTEAEIALTRATYDATLAELDDLFAELIESLEADGHLDDTIVVLTSDHGEHLGEQHMLDHQYSVYEPLLRVPLVVHYPSVITPGRESRPVMNFDLFPTLLELTGVDPPAGLDSRAVSLLRPADERVRFAEDPAFSKLGVRVVQQQHPDWDPSPWQRNLRTLVEGDRKLIWGSDGRYELFDLGEDPLETQDLSDHAPDEASRLQEVLDAYFASLADCESGGAQFENLSPEQRELLKSLGYLD
jgi:arylsulfatase A-like enzyme